MEQLTVLISSSQSFNERLCIVYHVKAALPIHELGVDGHMDDPRELGIGVWRLALELSQKFWRLKWLSRHLLQLCNRFSPVVGLLYTILI